MQANLGKGFGAARPVSDHARMKWHPFTAIYEIGNRYPVAFFQQEQLAQEWAKQHLEGEWIAKPVKLPPLPLASKAAKKDLKQIASVLDHLDWSEEQPEQEPVAERQPDQVIFAERPEP